MTSPAYAGCLFNVLANYVDAGGTIMSVSFIVIAFFLLRQDNLRDAKKLVLAGAALLTLTVGMCTSLNSDLWYTPGVIANSETWFESGCPAHWISLLIIAIVFSLLFLCCALLPTIIAFHRGLENRRPICNSNLMVLLIPGAFDLAPGIFYDIGSSFVMMFWRTLFTNPATLAEIPPFFYASIAVWNVLLGIFAFVWGKLLLNALKPNATALGAQ